MATDYQKVTSTDQLVAGAKYVIGTDAGSFIATNENNNNRKITTAEVTDGVVTATDAMMVFELGGEAGAWTFATVNYLGTAGYLNTTSTTGSNNLKIVAELDQYAYFTIAIEEGVTTVTGTGKDSRNILYQNGTTCFSCYNTQSSSQYHKPNLYKEIGGGDDPQPQPQPLANGYYLVGNQYNWTPAAERMFAVNPANEAEMVLAGVELAADDSLKVVYVENEAIVTWFPNNAGNYVVDAAHAGEKDIYFRADYAGDQNYWYAGCIYIAENVVPVADFTQPFTLKFNGTGNSGTDASAAFAAEVAAIFDAASAPYVAEVTDATKVYAGRPIADDNSSVKFGTTSAQGTLAFTLAQAIEVDSIVVNATQYGNNASKITVNGTEFDLNAGNKVPQNVKITPAGEISAITIAQGSSERMYLRAVTIYPKQGGGDDPQPQPVLANGYYLVGNQYNWTPAAERMFAVNPANEAEMVLAGVELAADDSLKVVYVENEAIVTWFPNNAGNYVVDAAHAGEKDIYFRADYAGDQNYWYAGCIYIAENVVPVADFTQPFTLKFNGTGNSGTDASAAFAAEVAAIFDAASAPYVAEVTDATKVYAGRPIADDNSSVKFGTTSAQGTLAFTLAQAIEVDSIVVNATQYGNNASKITVNGTEFDLNAGNKVPQNVKITPAGEISAITIAQSSSERMYLRYVAVYPKQGGVDPQPLADGFYLVGTMNEWTPAAEYKFAVNPDNEAEMVLANVELLEGAELKVRQVENGEATAWFPNNAGNYVVDADHAGLKDIYFRADYQGAEDWYAGCIYIAANSGTAIINTEAAKVAVKQLRNGMVIIRRGDREYSIMGQLVK